MPAWRAQKRGALTATEKVCAAVSSDSSIPAAPEQCFDLVVVTQERYKEISRPVLKNETERETASTLKEPPAEFTNAEAAVRVRLAKCLSQFA